ncbi:MAG: phosphate acyltransferase PlsX [Deltaproteobacteria bacterium]|nr:phosphate acyltransferase PlsX [Deltaproteobacteria bacterium]
MPNSSKPCIAVDAMGGDFGVEVAVVGALEAVRDDEIDVVLVGREPEIKACLPKAESIPGISIRHAEEVVSMSDKPSDMLRRKKDSSIQVACRLVREGLAHGVVSAGNSGATLASGMFILGRIEGIERPGLATILPTEREPIVLIDVGGNVDCKPYNLVQFGFMADVLARDVLGRKNPKVGILNIGEEEGKGNFLTKETHTLFKLTGLNFIGNVEGRDIFTGNADVIVCDGFVGNVALKLSEGLSTSLIKMLRQELFGTWVDRIGTFLARKAFRRYKKKVDYAEYGGALLLGLKGIAVVCHGASNSRAITKAVQMAATFVRNQANEHLEQGLAANKNLGVFAKRALPARKPA